MLNDLDEKKKHVNKYNWNKFLKFCRNQSLETVRGVEHKN